MLRAPGGAADGSHRAACRACPCRACPAACRPGGSPSAGPSAGPSSAACTHGAESVSPGIPMSTPADPLPRGAARRRTDSAGRRSPSASPCVGIAHHTGHRWRREAMPRHAGEHHARRRLWGSDRSRRRRWHAHARRWPGRLLLRGRRGRACDCGRRLRRRIVLALLGDRSVGCLCTHGVAGGTAERPVRQPQCNHGAFGTQDGAEGTLGSMHRSAAEVREAARPARTPPLR